MSARVKKAKTARYKDKSKLGGMVKVIFPYVGEKGSYRFREAMVVSENLRTFLQEQGFDPNTGKRKN